MLNQVVQTGTRPDWPVAFGSPERNALGWIQDEQHPKSQCQLSLCDIYLECTELEPGLRPRAVGIVQRATELWETCSRDD